MDSSAGEGGFDPMLFLQPLIRNCLWMKIMGGFLIFVGVIYCISIVGAIVGFVPLWTGIALYGAANLLDSFSQASNIDDANKAMAKLGTFFKVNGIFFMVVIFIYCLFALVFGIAFFTGYAP